MENDKIIYVFIGPPYSGKETQTTPLSGELGIPVFSMGKLIRDARTSNQQIESAFQEFTVNGLHVPIEIKFNLLKDEMDNAENGFILDNFPATREDLQAFNSYLEEHKLTVNRAFYLNISEAEMLRRHENNPERERLDDTPETLKTRYYKQGDDRVAVLEYFREKGILVEIDGEKPVGEVKTIIKQNL
jgi:adenylate kinase